MINVYVYYPNPHLTIYTKRTCNDIGKMKKPGQRTEKVTTASFSTVVPMLVSNKFQFGATAPKNDLWLEVDFDDEEFEKAFARYVLQQFAKRYRPFNGAHAKTHC